MSVTLLAISMTLLAMSMTVNIWYDLVSNQYDLVNIQYDLVNNEYDLVNNEYDLVTNLYASHYTHFSYKVTQDVQKARLEEVQRLADADVDEAAIADLMPSMDVDFYGLPETVRKTLENLRGIKKLYGKLIECACMVVLWLVCWCLSC